MDDVYAIGPAQVVFSAIARFAEAIRDSLGLQMQVEKSSCYSHDYDLSTCPWRHAAQIPIGTTTLREVTDDGEPRERQVRGVMVGGVPLGTPDYICASLTVEVDGIVSYIDSTVSQLLADSPHAVWAALYYCCSSRFDFWLRHVPPSQTLGHARRVDDAISRAVESLGYEGMLTDRITSVRFRLPARMRGLGLRSRVELAPAAYVACFAESAETFLPRMLLPGYFPMLGPLFGTADAHLTQFVQRTGSAIVDELRAAWALLRQEVHGAGVRGPLDQHVGYIGVGRDGSAGLQRAITSQREQVARDRLHHQIVHTLPHTDSRRQAWLACDSFSTGWVGSWPTDEDSLSPGEFREFITT